MKAISFVLCALMLSVATMALSQVEMRKPDVQQTDAQQASAQLAFARLKTLAGRMVGTLSPDGKTVKFDFLDVSGGTRYGHMHQAVFTIIDADHHTEDWTYMTPADRPGQAHIDLVRAK